jgi:uncharacterized surface protein with fasciclin (FAS1) repeats
MNSTATKFKSLALMAAAFSTLLFAGTAFAGKGMGKGKVVPGKPGEATIVEIAVAVNNGGEGEFNFLLAAVECFGPLTTVPGDNPIVDLLNGEDKYTLFAPTDAAFEALLDALDVTDPCDDAQLDQDLLNSVLTYHVVEGRRFSNSIFNSNEPKMIETLLGVDITSYVLEESPILMDLAGQTVNVVAPFNVNASNGVIHTIDTVLLPLESE